MLCLNGFEPYSRWVPLIVPCINIDRFSFYICLILMSPPVLLPVFDHAFGIASLYCSYPPPATQFSLP